jgi:hypothetical protein
MRARALAALALSMAATAAAGSPMMESLRPVARPVTAVADAGPLRPLPRPVVAEPEVMRATLAPAFALALPAAIADLRPEPRPVPKPVAAAAAAPAASLRPEARSAAEPMAKRRLAIAGGPEVIELAAFRAPQATAPVTGRKGAVCGDPAILGKSIPPILSRVKGCGLEDGVSVTSVAGVALTQPASIDCATAQALKDWVEGGVKPAVGRKGGGVAALQVAASYTCRPRNNQSGARVSEHGRGQALDIAAILLADGTAVTVEQGWGTKRSGATLATMRKAACGPFNTVLGPGSDRFHHDHFHLDTARGRGPYCR